jgi:hypothetical protein
MDTMMELDAANAYSIMSYMSVQASGRCTAVTGQSSVQWDTVLGECNHTI